MKFVWDLSEKEWDRYPTEIRHAAEWDSDGIVNSAGVVGCCRVGDLCFDIRAWGQLKPETDKACGLGYELYVGGVENYAYDAEGRPYDLVEEYGEFPISVTEMDLKDFKRMAEKTFRKFIMDVAPRYKYANLMAKANGPLKIW